MRLVYWLGLACFTICHCIDVLSLELPVMLFVVFYDFFVSGHFLLEETHQ